MKIKLYDDNNTFLGESTASLGVIDEKPVHTWSVYLDIAVSPTTLGGKLRVFPTDQGESSRLTQTINVQFETLSLPDRVKMYGPLRLQLMTGKPVLFRGQMKDFSDNQMHIRLKDEVGKVFFKDIIDPNEDNIGKFAYFTKTVDYKYVPSTSEKGTWEIYTLDAENQETVIFSIPVRFKKSNS